MTLDAEVIGNLESARRRVFDAHCGDPNFTGCAIGYRRCAGELTAEPAVIAMVVRKRPEGAVSRYRLLPSTVRSGGRSWRVDVVEAGPLAFSSTAGAAQAAAAAQSGQITALVRPPVQGCSISNINNGDAGTLGCFATDNSDGTICLVSSSHVLALDGQATDGQLIIQPALADNGSVVDGIGSLKRWIAFGSGTNYVDAAVAQLTDQADYGTGVVDDLMAAISPSHPAVGMVVADDSAFCGVNCFLSRMDHTTSELGVTLIAATSQSTAVVAPSVGMSIEKVGRTTGYTSSIIDAIGAQVKVQYGGSIVTLSDMIWTQAFSQPGDSGAVACQGGTGTVYAPFPGGCVSSGCPLVNAMSTYYNIPLNSSANLTLADDVRDKFLAMSNTGQLLTGVVYLNAQTVIDRLTSNTGQAHNQSVAQARAQSLFSQYHDLAVTLAGSGSPAAVVTSTEVNAIASILYGLTAPVSAGGTAMLTAAESAAAWALYSDVVKPAAGMNRQQLIAYMNESAVFQQVHSQLAAVPTVKITGTLSAG